MNRPDQDTLKAIGRLASTHDFMRVVDWLKGEHTDAVKALVECPTVPRVHQLQGTAQALGDILQAIRSAQPALPHVG